MTAVNWFGYDPVAAGRGGFAAQALIGVNNDSG
jgi:hypothetical protein